jgi:hypothetical protein
MYYDNSKRSYYRFPSKNNITDFDTQVSYYFPDKNSSVSDNISTSCISSINYYEDAGECSQRMDI